MRPIGLAVALSLLSPLAGAAPPSAPLPLKPASQMSAGELRAAVEGLLAGYEPPDPSAALRRLGPPAADVLLRIAQDPAVSPLRRLRAIEALGHVPTPAGLQYLRQLVSQRRGATDSLGIYELAAAARALGGFSALADVAPLLDHPSADVREGAAAALMRMHTPEALRLLQRRPPPSSSPR